MTAVRYQMRGGCMLTMVRKKGKTDVSKARRVLNATVTLDVYVSLKVHQGHS